jgi:hypothetical protein
MTITAATPCECRLASVPLYPHDVLHLLVFFAFTKSHPNRTCRNEEWTFLWSRRPWLSWAKVLFIIVSQYSRVVNWAH